MNTISLRGVRGVPDTEVPAPDEGGLVVLRGGNGAGKSRALAAIAALTDGEGRVPLADDRRSGEVAGFGAAIVLGGRTVRGGELDVIGLTSRLDVANIVDPPFKDRDAANRHVVRSLVRMLGLPADPAAFADLAGGPEAFAALMPAGLDTETDLVELARKIKAAFDEAARRARDEAAKLDGEASALMAAGKDLDLAAPHDADELARAVDLAREAQGAIRERQEAHARLATRAAEARQALGADGGPSDEQMVEAQRAAQAAESVHGQAAREVEGKAARVAELRAALSAAEREHEAATVAAARARDKAEAAHQRVADLEDAFAGWEAARAAVRALEAADPPPSAEEVAAAATAVATAKEAERAGVLIRDAIEKRALGAEVRKAAGERREREQRLREAGRSTDAVLSRLINEAGVEQFFVLDGDVLARLPDGTTRPFLDLSDGERTKLAIDATVPVALRGVPETEKAVLTLGQRVFQDLDEPNRVALREHVRGRRVLLYTALPTSGPLHAVVEGADGDD